MMPYDYGVLEDARTALYDVMAGVGPDEVYPKFFNLPIFLSLSVFFPPRLFLSFFRKKKKFFKKIHRH